MPARRARAPDQWALRPARRGRIQGGDGLVSELRSAAISACRHRLWERVVGHRGSDDLKQRIRSLHLDAPARPEVMRQTRARKR